jgi:long-chain acyl-CoA synthetase
MIGRLVGWHSHQGVALVTPAGDHVSYGQLRQDVDALAQQLSARQLVFLLGSNDRVSITSYLACLTKGAVPLLLGRDVSQHALRALVDCYRPTTIVAPLGLLPLDMGYVSVWSSDGYGHHQALSPCATPSMHQSLSLLLATSGSTGSPKLVRLTLDNLIANAASICQYLDIDSNERAITSLPFHYSYGLSVINSHLHAGATLVLSDHSLMEAVFWKQLQDHKVTSMAGVPYSYDILLKLRFQRMALPYLKTLTQAGGRLEREKQAQIHHICQQRGMRFFTMYGQTEATARVAYLPPDQLQEKLGSIGLAIPGGQLHLEDEAGRVIDAPNQLGELVYTGKNVALGYAETREDLSRGDDWGGVLRTGDLAKQDTDGCFYIEGRKRRFLKIHGVRVSLDAVEAWLSSCGLSAAAHGRDDLLCVTVASPDETFDAPACQRKLVSDFGIHPTALQWRSVDALPRLGTGKVDYPCLNTMS